MLRHVVMYRRDRSAFTILEFLAVIVISGMMIAFLFPAIQGAREASRRMQCSNNLRQIGVALHNYYDNHKAFPAGQGEVYSPGASWHKDQANWAAIFFLMPHMEQTEVYREVTSYKAGECAWIFESIGANAGWYGAGCDPSFRSRLRDSIPSLLCPSDGHAFTTNERDETGKSSYLASRGDAIRDNGGRWNNEADEYKDIARSRGMFPAYTWHRIDDIADGLGNTLAFAEGVTAVPGSRNIKEVLAESVTLNAHANPQAACGMAVIAVEDTLKDGVKARVARGVRAFDGRTVYSGFTTVLPPNNPACARGSWGEVNDNYSFLENEWGVFPPTSHHLGGANGLFADGSVRLISDSVHCGDQSHAQPVSGPSPYGVWGALGSINGGEAVTLP